ncbi:Os05g0298900 [Oryza sativa Japonica Group]|uniref:Os05g0298900 protein n=1 Tax=Oryza sativa subsp. japonica TaxID=39947 RepID=Q0DJD4_ORYSJ|nr:hypothetical protein DAI22_05g103600 [Oryza sativa Japonica Group]BAF17039.1 Os05g0298900 [Oryza sativa Japonica Group]|eukprot:NP_001055125.1 Os05g0298900 [Oryza sativa Japonica Group]
MGRADPSPLGRGEGGSAAAAGRAPPPPPPTSSSGPHHHHPPSRARLRRAVRPALRGAPAPVRGGDGLVQARAVAAAEAS